MALSIRTAGALTPPGRRLVSRQTIEGYACILPWLVGFLAFEGERVRPGQPVAWLRLRPQP